MSIPPCNILMADDDFEDLEIMDSLFAMVDPKINLLKVTNGKAVVDYLERKNDQELPSLIILDYNMPELSGPEVLKVICNKKRYKKIPKLMLSTSSAPAHITECISNGATEYFVKPDNLEGLRSLAQKILFHCKQDY